MKRLTAEGQELADEFDIFAEHYGGCWCHVSPPCSYCTHPGNPLCPEESPDLWEESNFFLRLWSRFKTRIKR